MTPTQLIMLMALGLIGLGIIASITLIANGFWQLRAERQSKQSLLARLHEVEKS